MALYRLDREGLIVFSTIAGSLAGMKTDSSADTWKWVLLLYQFPGLAKFPLPYQDHKPFNVIPSRTGFVTGRCFDGILRLEIPPCPSLIPEHRPQGDGD
jgi:hypothetical protein